MSRVKHFAMDELTLMRALFVSIWSDTKWDSHDGGRIDEYTVNTWKEI